MASWKGHKDVLDTLIKAGCNIDAKGDGNDTALIFASWKGFPNCVDLLVTAGCDIEAADLVKLNKLIFETFNKRNRIKYHIVIVSRRVDSTIAQLSLLS